MDDNMQKLNKAGGVVGGVHGALSEKDDVFVEPSKTKGVVCGEAEVKPKPKEGLGGAEGSRVGGGGTPGEGTTLERPTSIPLLKERKASGEVEGHTQNEGIWTWCYIHE